MKLLTPLDVESPNKNDVKEAFNKKFMKRTNAPLITNDYESSQLSANGHFIDNNFEIYSDYAIKS